VMGPGKNYPTQLRSNIFYLDPSLVTCISSEWLKSSNLNQNQTAFNLVTKLETASFIPGLKYIVGNHLGEENLRFQKNISYNDSNIALINDSLL